LNFYTGMDDKNQRHQDIRQIIALENINSQKRFIRNISLKGAHSDSSHTFKRFKTTKGEQNS
jgi:arginine repressor